MLSPHRLGLKIKPPTSKPVIFKDARRGQKISEPDPFAPDPPDVKDRHGRGTQQNIWAGQGFETSAGRPAAGRGLPVTGEVTKPDEVTLRARLATLSQEHRDLDAAIDALSGAGSGDQLALSRLKTRKLQLNDEIAEINTALLPDISA